MRSSGRPSRAPIFIVAVCAALAACGTRAAPGASAVPSPNPVASLPTLAASPTGSPSAAPSSPSAPAGPVLFGPLPANRLDDATAARLQASLDTIRREHYPDAIAAIITPDGIWSGAAGVDGPKGRAATAMDEFAIASVTKTVTAALILRLAEEARIDLEAPLAKYLPGVGQDANGASVLQAVRMESGMGDTVQAFFDRTYAHCDRSWTRQDLLTTFGHPVGPAGTSNYSNPSYKLLGFAAEHASGLALDQALRRYVLDPVGADGMAMQGMGTDTRKPWALPTEGHTGDMSVEQFGLGGALPCLAYASGSLSASGMASDAETLARWGWSLFAGDIVDAASLQLMMRGAGLEFTDVGARAFGHTGHEPGYASILAVIPKDQTVIVAFVNDGDADMTVNARFLLDALRG